MPVVPPAPFLCNYLITRCDVILTLGHISRWNTLKIDLATSWRAPGQVSASARLPVERMSTLFTCHYFQKQLEDSQPQWNESETVTWLWVTPGSHKKISVFLINNHSDRYSAITSASHHASIEFFGPLVLRRKICALCGHGDFRDIQVASGRWQLPVNLRPVQWGARLLQHATVQLWATHFKHL